jgi:hypothetical protein
MRGLTHRWLARTVPADIRRSHEADRRVGHVVGTVRAEAQRQRKTPALRPGLSWAVGFLSIEP